MTAAADNDLTCDTCAFFSGKGRCHRFPPVRQFHIVFYGFGWTSDEHPNVDELDWCGEHRPREVEA